MCRLSVLLCHTSSRFALSGCLPCTCDPSFFFFSSRRRHTRFDCDWSSDVCSSDLVFDTPISEAGIAGAAVGLCFAGWRPVVEMQFDAFSYPAMEQVVDHVAKMRMRVRGRVDMSITMRIPAFGGIKGKEHHGESPETYYAHTAGLKVVAPSSALDAYRLLRQAIADPDPVIVLEPKARYWSKESGELASDGPGIGNARGLRDRGHVDLGTY